MRRRCTFRSAEHRHRILVPVAQPGETIDVHHLRIIGGRNIRRRRIVRLTRRRALRGLSGCSAKIHHQPAIDEHPQVARAAEAQAVPGARPVSEPAGQFQCAGAAGLQFDLGHPCAGATIGCAGPLELDRRRRRAHARPVAEPPRHRPGRLHRSALDELHPRRPIARPALEVPARTDKPLAAGIAAGAQHAVASRDEHRAPVIIEPIADDADVAA
jgi:hypothetical protein